MADTPERLTHTDNNARLAQFSREAIERSRALLDQTSIW